MDTSLFLASRHGTNSAYSEVARGLVNATIDVVSKTASSAYEAASKTFAGMEVNSYGVPMPMVRAAESTSTWVSRTQVWQKHF